MIVVSQHCLCLHKQHISGVMMSVCLILTLARTHCLSIYNQRFRSNLSVLPQPHSKVALADGARIRSIYSKVFSCASPKHLPDICTLRFPLANLPASHHFVLGACFSSSDILAIWLRGAFLQGCTATAAAAVTATSSVQCSQPATQI